MISEAISKGQIYEQGSLQNITHLYHTERPTPVGRTERHHHRTGFVNPKVRAWRDCKQTPDSYAYDHRRRAQSDHSEYHYGTAVVTAASTAVSDLAQLSDL